MGSASRIVLCVMILGWWAPASAQDVPPTPQSTVLKDCLSRNGIVYGPFRDGQSPDAGIYPTEAQIEEDLTFISQVTTRVRIYSTKGSFAAIPKIAAQLGIAVTQGIHLGPDREANEEQLATGIALARADQIESLVVGNEVLTGATLSKEELIAYLRRVRREVPSYVPVTTGETWDKWIANPELAGEVDYVLAHFYPFWERLPIEGAASNVFARYSMLQTMLARTYPVRRLRIVIGESGWPSSGTPIFPAAVPSPQNQRTFAEELLTQACERSIPLYYFSAFDEEFKWNEGGSNQFEAVELPLDRNFSGRHPGSSWGIFRSDGTLKAHFADAFPQPEVGTRRERHILVNGRLSTFYDVGVDSSAQRREWLISTEDSLKLSYPSGQDWGAVFVTVGAPTAPPRPWKDFSTFSVISVELKGDRGGEVVEVGWKSAGAPDDGSERKVRLTLRNEYERYDIPLTLFQSSRVLVPEDLQRTYVVAEFVFGGRQAQTIHVRNISYKADH
jgi:exo-beta-1,3-glucanase (GH17 family)